MMPGKIIIIDHDPKDVKLVESTLNREGYHTLAAENGATGLSLVRRELPTLVILDLILPDCNGFLVLKQIQTFQQTRSIPIMILTARSDETDLVLGLELGADDYITKPFSPRELAARIKAILRGYGYYNNAIQEEIPGLIGIDEIRIDLQKHLVIVRGKETELTTKEYELLKLLLSIPGKAFTREFLLEFIWGYEYTGGTRTVDVHIRRLRQKIEINPDAPVFIETIRNVGYRFNDPMNT
jgi:two-component system, OmpR family, alkaline phosphatase synthesis response regulator PhoP